MVRPMRRSAPYYEAAATGLSPIARSIWDGLDEDGHRHWLYRQAERGGSHDDPRLALVIGELQNNLLDRGHWWLGTAIAVVLFGALAYLQGDASTFFVAMGGPAGSWLHRHRRLGRLRTASEINLERGLTALG